MISFCVFDFTQMFGIANLKIICTDCTEISFSKLRSADLNYHLPKLGFFTDPYCVEVSNKQLLIKFFTSSCDVSRTCFYCIKASEYDQEIQQSQTADQTTAP